MKDIFILFSVLFVFAGSAHAGHDKSRYYVSGSASYLLGTYGIQSTDDRVIPEPGGGTGTLVEQGYSNKIKGSIGFDHAFIAAIGKELEGYNVRVELEYSYRTGAADGDADNSVNVSEVRNGSEIMREITRETTTETTVEGITTTETTTTGTGEFEGTGTFNTTRTATSLSFKLPASGDYRIHALMVNVYEDFYNNGPFTLYFGLGLGVSIQITDYTVTGARRLTGPSLDNDVEIFQHQVNETDIGAGYQGMLGVAAEITDSISANLGYRFFDSSDTAVSHGLEAGLRYSF